MSVVVQAESSLSLYFKGSPEKLSELARKDSLPANYHKMLDFVTNKGFRVLALAYSKIPQSSDLEALAREAVEQDLTYLGLLVLENKLKPDSAEVIRRLQKEGGLKTKVISGDNVLTTLETA